jgi:hypothetical protein
MLRELRFMRVPNRPSPSRFRRDIAIARPPPFPFCEMETLFRSASFDVCARSRSPQIICLPRCVRQKVALKWLFYVSTPAVITLDKKSGGTASFDVRSNFPFNFYIKSVIQMLTASFFLSNLTWFTPSTGSGWKIVFAKLLTFNYNVFRQQKVDSLAKEPLAGSKSLLTNYTRLREINDSLLFPT